MVERNQTKHQKSILIVDDEPQNIHLLGVCLKQDYQILVATSGQQALDKLAQAPYPDMILLDVIMPDLDGYQVCQEIKANPKTQDIPIIFVTAKDSERDEQQSLEIGAVDFISKPFSNAIVLARVKAHMALQEQRAQIKQSEALLKTTIESTKDGIIAFSNEGQLLVVNQNFIRMWNIPEDILLSRSLSELLPYAIEQLVDGESRIRQVHHILASDRIETAEIEFKDGRIFSRYTKPLIQDGKKIGRIANYTDITEQKKLEQQLRELSVTDPLTGLYNRRKLKDILNDEFSRARRFNQDLAIIMLDIDHFKDFNDTYGHEQGDRILQTLADQMKRHFRNFDWCCRYGGEEFCIIMPGSSRQGVIDAAERFRQLIQHQSCDGLSVSISIGVSVSSLLHESAEQLLNEADKALYQAKKNGRNQVQIYQE